MRIRGICAYVANDSDINLLDDCELSNTTLVIDGWSLASAFYSKSVRNYCCFNGDYDHYSNYLTKFFKVLLDNRVTPLVIFDGGSFKEDKDEEVNKKKEHIKKFRKCTEGNYYRPGTDREEFVPQHHGNVFVNVLKKMGIKFGVCAYNAHKTIVAIAQILCCPVLAKNPDFMISRITYVLIRTIVDFKMNSAIKCQIYRPENLKKRFPGLKISLLSLLPVIVGDDECARLIFKKLLHLQRHPRHPLELSCMRIHEALKWLRNYSSPESAINDILIKIPGEKRAEIVEFIQNTLADYLITPSKDVLRYLGLTEEQMKNYNDDEFIGVRPEWIAKELLVGNLDPALQNMVIHHSHYPPIQIEDFKCTSIHEISINIIQAIYDLLMSTQTKENHETALQLGIRNVEDFKIMKLEVKRQLVPLDKIRKLDNKSKLNIINNVLNIPDSNFMGKFPNNWRLYLATAVYWMKQDVEPKRDENHLNALLLAMLFGIIDKKLGYLRSQSAFKKKYYNDISRINKGKKILTNFKDITVIEALETVTNDDCIMAAQYFLPNFERERIINFVEEGRVRSSLKTTWITIFHIFEQFQSCLRYSKTLNELLGNVCLSPPIEELYNGTLLYNLCRNFSQQQNVDDYLSDQLKLAPGLLQVFKLLKKNVLQMLKHNPTALENMTDEKIQKNSETGTKEPQIKSIAEPSTSLSQKNNKVHHDDDSPTTASFPKPLSADELKLEIMERQNRRNNLRIRSNIGLDLMTAARAIELIRIIAKIDPQVKDIKYDGKDELIITLGNMEIKKKVMAELKNFHESDIRIRNDNTARENEIQRKIEKLAESKRMMGRVVEVKYMKLKIDKVWWKYHETRGKFEIMNYISN